MKKLFLGLTFLASISSFATDVCVITTSEVQSRVQANCTNPTDRVSRKSSWDNNKLLIADNKAVVIKELLEKGYRVSTDTILVRD